MARFDDITWDERADDHIAAHGVRYIEVKQAVDNILHAHRSGKYMLVIGQTESGRYITVILDDEGDGLWYPVTAMPTRQSEMKFVRRRKGKRGK